MAGMTMNMNEKAVENKAIYDTVRERVGSAINATELSKALYVGGQVASKARMSNQYMSDALAWSLLSTYHKDGEVAYKAAIQEIIITSGLRNEVKRTLKVALQRTTTTVTDKEQKLTIEEKDGKLSIDLEDVTQTTLLDKAISSVAKKAVAENKGITALLDAIRIEYGQQKELADQVKKTGGKVIKLPAMSKKEVATSMIAMVKDFTQTETRTRKAVNA